MTVKYKYNILDNGRFFFGVDLWIDNLQKEGIDFDYSQDYLDVLNMYSYPEVYELKDLEYERICQQRTKEAKKIVEEIERDINNKYIYR